MCEKRPQTIVQRRNGIEEGIAAGLPFTSNTPYIHGHRIVTHDRMDQNCTDWKTNNENENDKKYLRTQGSTLWGYQNRLSVTSSNIHWLIWAVKRLRFSQSACHGGYTLTGKISLCRKSVGTFVLDNKSQRFVLVLPVPVHSLMLKWWVGHTLFGYNGIDCSGS